jgi:hypothetical protein
MLLFVIPDIYSLPCFGPIFTDFLCFSLTFGSEFKIGKYTK